MNRRAEFADEVIPNLRDLYPPSSVELEALFNAIQELQVNPTLGIEVYYPGADRKVYELQVGRYKIFYSFSASVISILFIGY